MCYILYFFLIINIYDNITVFKTFFFLSIIICELSFKKVVIKNYYQPKLIYCLYSRYPFNRCTRAFDQVSLTHQPIGPISNRRTNIIKRDSLILFNVHLSYTLLYVYAFRVLVISPWYSYKLPTTNFIQPNTTKS